MNKAIRWVLISLVFFIPLNVILLWGFFFGVSFTADHYFSILSGIVVISVLFSFGFFITLLRHSIGEDIFGRKIISEKPQNIKHLVFWMIFSLILPILVAYGGIFLFVWVIRLLFS